MHGTAISRVVTRMSSHFAGNVPLLPPRTHWRTCLFMSTEPRINLAKLKAAIIDATGPSKEFTRRGLSMKASDGRNPDLVRDLISRGQDRKPSLETVAGIAAALGKPLSDFVADPIADSNEVEVIGNVEAGVWRESHLWPEDRRYKIDVPPSPIPGAVRRGLNLQGFSMDKTIPPGSDLEYLCTVENGIAPQAGDLVIALRRQGDLYETTCKRLAINADGDYVLLAESTRPEFQEPIVLGKPDNNHFADSSVEIIGIVVRTYQGHFRRG